MRYYTIAEMIEAIDEPNRSACLKLYNDSVVLFKQAPGSSHNHQAWDGGYHDHITEVMNICMLLYSMYNTRSLNFSLGDALLIMFLHDLEKPWLNQIIDPNDKRPILAHWENKKRRKTFRENKIKEYGIVLTEQQQNAMQYVEGENDDYSSKKRVMNELAAFCHVADVSSARIWHNYGSETKW